MSAYQENKFQNIPEALTQINNWVLVKLVHEPDGSTNKVPVGFNRNGCVYQLKWSDSSNLRTFQGIKSAYEAEMAKPEGSRRFHGVGFVLSNSGFMAVDLDKAFDGRKLKPFASEILDNLNGYVELSQSGTGFHIIVSRKGWDAGTKRGKFEDGSGIDVLSDGSYVMITGDKHELSGPLTNEQQDFTVLKSWQQKLKGVKLNHTPSKSAPFDHNLPLQGWTAERIRTEIFPRIPNFEDRDNWRDVGFALHNQFEGKQEGLDLFHEYSSQDPSIYDPKAVDDLWRSVKPNPNRANKTLRWLLFLARKELGWAEDRILGDLDNAKLFKAMYEGEFLYCHSKRQWLRYDGLRWSWCIKGEEIEAAKSACLVLADRAAELFKLNQEDQKWKLWFAHAKTSRGNKRLEAMLSLAQSEPEMSIASINELDSNGMLLGVRNGVIDLKTGTLLNPDPKLMITKQTNTNFYPSATCPHWIKFMSETFMGDQSLVRYVQKALGYSLTGDVSQEVLHFCFGGGSNGKSVMANVIQDLLGDYVVTANFDLLSVRDSSNSNDIARLSGARVVLANETKENEKLDDQKLKALVSTEMITARFLYGEHFEFRPQFKIWLRGNHKPIITDNSEGAWRRIRLIPFENKVPLERRDYGLQNRLLAEKEGILNWIIEGCLFWQKEKLNQIPARIEDASKEYRDESDILSEFLEDECVLDPGEICNQQDLFFRWKLWCERNGLQHYSRNSFTRKIRSRGFESIRRNENGRTVRYYKGLRRISDNNEM